MTNWKSVRRNKRWQAACLGLVLLGVRAANAAPSTGVAGGAPVLPKYECHSLREGDGRAVPQERRQQIEATRQLSDAEAVQRLQEYLADTRWSRYEQGVVYYELAWRSADLGDVLTARRAIFEVLGNAYMEGAKIDAARSLLAQLAADEEDWDGVIAALAPVLDKQCRFAAASLMESLAAAYVKQARWADALTVLDIRPQSLAVPWRRIALLIDCDLNGVEACVTRTVAYAQEKKISPEFADVINAELTRLSKLSLGKELLAAAQQRGQLTDDWRVDPREPVVVEKIEVLESVSPTYPRDAVKSAQSGYVVLDITVGTDGKVLEAYVVDASPPNVFEEASLRAAYKSRYKPEVRDGQAVVTTGRYRIQFDIQ